MNEHPLRRVIIPLGVVVAVNTLYGPAVLVYTALRHDLPVDQSAWLPALCSPAAALFVVWVRSIQLSRDSAPHALVGRAAALLALCVIAGTVMAAAFADTVPVGAPYDPTGGAAIGSSLVLLAALLRPFLIWAKRVFDPAPTGPDPVRPRPDYPSWSDPPNPTVPDPVRPRADYPSWADPPNPRVRDWGRDDRPMPEQAPPAPGEFPGFEPAAGHIWWAELPFDDEEGGKVRPCLVVRTHRYYASVLKITSRNKSQRPEYIRIPASGWDRRARHDSWLELGPTRDVFYSDFRDFAGRCPDDVWAIIKPRHGPR